MRASVEVECNSPEKILKAIEVDFEPQAKSKISLRGKIQEIFPATDKFSAKLSGKKEKIILDVEAKDISGLMAGINSNLKLIKLAGEVFELE